MSYYEVKGLLDKIYDNGGGGGGAGNNEGGEDKEWSIFCRSCWGRCLTNIYYYSKFHLT